MNMTGYSVFNMTTLHTVNKSPLTSPCLRECLRLAANNDAVLLIEDGVYAADKHHASLFTQTTATIYVLEADAKARGVIGRLNNSVQVIDDAGFVALVVQCENAQSWY